MGKFTIALAILGLSAVAFAAELSQGTPLVAAATSEKKNDLQTDSSAFYGYSPYGIGYGYGHGLYGHGLYGGYGSYGAYGSYGGYGGGFGYPGYFGGYGGYYYK